MEITLDELLASRDARAEAQKRLLGEFPGKTLVCLTVIMPGGVKRDFRSLIVAQAGMTALAESFGHNVICFEAKDLQTGFEAYLVTDFPVLQTKVETCSIEDEHPLGRLFDIDVIGENGVPVSRKELGLPERKCLLCENTVWHCMRSHSHTREELLAKIDEMIDAYVR